MKGLFYHNISQLYSLHASTSFNIAFNLEENTTSTGILVPLPLRLAQNMVLGDGQCQGLSFYVRFFLIQLRVILDSAYFTSTDVCACGHDPQQTCGFMHDTKCLTQPTRTTMRTRYHSASFFCQLLIALKLSDE